MSCAPWALLLEAQRMSTLKIQHPNGASSLLWCVVNFITIPVGSPFTCYWRCLLWFIDSWPPPPLSPLCILTGGLPEQHRPHGGGELHLQPQHHHHGHGHLQQFGQLHHGHRSRRLAAPGHLLLPAPRLHGSVCPAALLLKLPLTAPIALHSSGASSPLPPHPLLALLPPKPIPSCYPA